MIESQQYHCTIYLILCLGLSDYLDYAISHDYLQHRPNDGSNHNHDVSHVLTCRHIIVILVTTSAALLTLLQRT